MKIIRDILISKVHRDLKKAIYSATVPEMQVTIDYVARTITNAYSKTEVNALIERLNALKMGDDIIY